VQAGGHAKKGHARYRRQPPVHVQTGGSKSVAATAAVAAAVAGSGGGGGGSATSFQRLPLPLALMLYRRSSVRCVTPLPAALDSPQAHVPWPFLSPHSLRPPPPQKIFETLIGKQQQFLLATQVVKMILKIDDVIVSGAYE
jgi:hypothetical protein